LKSSGDIRAVPSAKEVTEGGKNTTETSRAGGLHGCFKTRRKMTGTERKELVEEAAKPV